MNIFHQFFGKPKNRLEIVWILLLLFAPVISVPAANDPNNDHSQHPLIKKRTHDFGTVARGSKTVHDFKIVNSLEHPIVISEARSSCGCTRTSIPDKTVQPGDTGIIRAEYNTRSFLGNKSATITVVLVQPVHREIQLRVTGNIRGDVVLDPGELSIKKINVGESRSVSTQIHYAGKTTWQVVDVRSSLPFLVADLEETERKQGSVKYQLTVTMKGDFPEGQIRDSLTLVTNDKNQKLIPVPFTARAVSALTVSPQTLEIRQPELRGGEPVKKRLILKADQPFRISKVDAGDKRVQVRYGETARKTQLVTLTYQPIDGIPVTNDISVRFETDLGKSYAQSVRIRITD